MSKPPLAAGLVFASLFLITLPGVVTSKPATEPIVAPLHGKHSIVRVGAIPDEITKEELTHAQQLWEGINEHHPDKVRESRSFFSKRAVTGDSGGDAAALAWLADRVLSGLPPDRICDIEAPFDRAYCDFFLGNDRKHLKEYLQRKYRVDDFLPSDPERHIKRRQFLEDLVLFNNPDRAVWEPVGEIVDLLRRYVKPGDGVIDLGTGFGFFAYRLAQLVGETGHVYAVDIEDSYIEHLHKLVTDYHVPSIVPSVSADDDIKIRGPVDAVFMTSLYHVIYTWSTHEKRDRLLKSIRQALKDDGSFIIIDNAYKQGEELHHSYVLPDFVVAQLYFYGFELKESRPIGENRFALVFGVRPRDENPVPTFASAPGQQTISIDSPRSLVHIGSLDTYDTTPGGTEAASLVLRAIEENDLPAAAQAVARYDQLIPAENFGGEYTALQWFADYLLATPAAQEAMTSDFVTRAYFDYLSADNYARLRSYLRRKYKLGKTDLTPAEAVDEDTLKIGQIIRQEMEDFILFNNPRREQWEHSSRIIDALALKPGMTIADLGSGPGYYSFKFAKLVGDTGRVYAIDTKKGHLDFIDQVAASNGVANIETVLVAPGVAAPPPPSPGPLPDQEAATAVSEVERPRTRLPESNEQGEAIHVSDPLPIDGPVDVVFLGSLYHVLYAVESFHQRDQLIQAIGSVLQPAGRLVIVDNDIVDDQTLPYHGPYIRPELIISQLDEYGFKLLQRHQIIPQRYMLVFQQRSSPEQAAVER